MQEQWVAILLGFLGSSVLAAVINQWFASKQKKQDNEMMFEFRNRDDEKTIRTELRELLQDERKAHQDAMRRQKELIDRLKQLEDELWSQKLQHSQVLQQNQDQQNQISQLRDVTLKAYAEAVPDGPKPRLTVPPPRKSPFPVEHVKLPPTSTVDMKKRLK